MRCYGRLLNISYRDPVTNEKVHKEIQAAIGEHDERLTLVKKRKLRSFDPVPRFTGLIKTILQGTVKGKRRRGRQKKRKKKKKRERVSKSGQEWTLPAQLGRLKTVQDGKGLLRIHLWCPNDLLKVMG